MAENKETALVPVTDKGLILNKTAKVSAIARAKTSSGGYVPHLGMAEVRAVAAAAGSVGRNQQRDKLLILVLFDGCLRVSEALGLRPKDVKQDADGWHLEIASGKGGKPGIAAISASLAAQLQAYCYRHGVEPEQRIFPINRTRAFQICELAIIVAGVSKPDNVGSCHVLRHSGAIERLRATSNPRAVQEQLRHSTAQMTLRYLKTLSADEAIAIQKEVDFQW
jgi:integrase/recombinase XerD